MSQVTSQNALVKDSTLQTLNNKLDTINNTLGGNTNIAPVFDILTNYNKGDMVNYNGILYVFTSNHAAGAWTGNDVIQTNVGSEINQLKSGLTEVNSKITAIGAILYGDHNNDMISVDTATTTALGSVVLTSGKWLLICAIDWASNNTGCRQVAFGSGVNPARDAATTTMAVTDSGKQTYQQVSRVYEVVTTETVTLYGYQTSGAALNAMPYIKAIKIS